MGAVRDWQGVKESWGRLLKERTGEGVEPWLRRIKKAKPQDRDGLSAWLTDQGVTGYARSLLLYEHFGYPDFLSSTADELIDGQYRDRPALRPILDSLLSAATSLGDVTVQARKTYISLVSPRRTFARIQASTRTRVDLGLRLKGVKPRGRLQASRIHESMSVQISFGSPEDLDDEALQWLQRAFEENA